jgi:hypothetical protein
VKGWWQEGEERVKRSVKPIPIPNPNPNPSSADVAERGVASIGVLIGNPVLFITGRKITRGKHTRAS